MSVKNIFAKFNQFFAELANFSGPLGLVLVFALAGLTFLNNQLNFDIPASTRVRDAANLTGGFETIEKLDLRELSEKTISSVPVTSSGYSYNFAYAAPSYATSYASAPAGFYIGEPTKVSSPAVDAGYGIMRYMSYGGRFLYAHSSLAFSPLKSLYPGDTFTATIDGVTSTYVVRLREVYAKSTLDGNSALRSAIYSASYRGNSYSLALMTCGNGGNDDSSYRLILFADRV